MKQTLRALYEISMGGHGRSMYYRRGENAPPTSHINDFTGVSPGHDTARAIMQYRVFFFPKVPFGRGDTEVTLLNSSTIRAMDVKGQIFVEYASTFGIKIDVAIEPPKIISTPSLVINRLSLTQLLAIANRGSRVFDFGESKILKVRARRVEDLLW